MVAEKSRVCFFLRCFGQHAFHIVYKSHVQHAIRLVQHEDFQAIQPNQSLPDKIVQLTGSGDEDIRPRFSASSWGFWDTPPNTTA